MESTSAGSTRVFFSCLRSLEKSRKSLADCKGGIPSISFRECASKLVLCWLTRSAESFLINFGLPGRRLTALPWSPEPAENAFDSYSGGPTNKTAFGLRPRFGFDGEA